MEPEFWHSKWQRNEIGFHKDEVHELLAKHWSRFELALPSRVFLPLCGKTRDIAWLLAKGHHVVGIELSQLAVEHLFVDLNITPNISESGSLRHYQADGIDIFAGDIFDLTVDELGTVDAIYDRAALVALPFETRTSYTQHLTTISHHAPQFLICFDYDQSVMNGPPFSIQHDEIKQHYQAHYQLSLIDSVDVAGGLKGKAKALENVWFLEPNT